MLTETKKLENNSYSFEDLKLSFSRFFKLLKYELASSCKVLVPVYCAVLIIGVLAETAARASELMNRPTIIESATL